MYSVYKIVNKLNNKFYIGVHKTENPHDSYMGSGKAIKKAIEKYGRHNFEKNILMYTEDRVQAYAYENLLTSDFNDVNNYNMKRGGIGGFTREDAYLGLVARSRKGAAKSQELGYGFGGVNSTTDPVQAGRKGGMANRGKAKSENHKKALSKSKRASTDGSSRCVSEQTSKKMSEKKKGSLHPFHGFHYITNGVESLRVPKDGPIPSGWKKGRIMNAIWITNGKDSKRISHDQPITEGWRRGRI